MKILYYMVHARTHAHTLPSTWLLSPPPCCSRSRCGSVAGSVASYAGSPAPTADRLRPTRGHADDGVVTASAGDPPVSRRSPPDPR